MSKAKEEKTNAMRILEKLGLTYTPVHYQCDEFTDGMQIADLLQIPYSQCYKTLVTKGADGGHYVFILPVDKELDLKKAAKSVGVKSVSMVPVKDIFALTGYIRGGCTAIGMKKQFPARLHAAAAQLQQIIVSGGKLGTQLRLSPADLCAAAGAQYADLISAPQA